MQRPIVKYWAEVGNPVNKRRKKWTSEQGQDYYMRNHRNYYPWFIGAHNLNLQLWDLYETGLGLLLICERCVAWSTCGTKSSESRNCP